MPYGYREAAAIEKDAHAKVETVRNGRRRFELLVTADRARKKIDQASTAFGISAAMALVTHATRSDSSRLPGQPSGIRLTLVPANVLGVSINSTYASAAAASSFIVIMMC